MISYKIKDTVHESIEQIKYSKDTRKIVVNNINIIPHPNTTQMDMIERTIKDNDCDITLLTEINIGNEEEKGINYS